MISAEERERLDCELNAYNNDLFCDAQREFEKSGVPSLKFDIEYLIEVVNKRLLSTRVGKPPGEAIGSFTGDSLARILTAKTYLEYEMFEIDESRIKDAKPGAHIFEVSFPYPVVEATEVNESWRRLVAALDDYMHTSAAIAKAANPSSTAARMFLRGWRITQRLLNENNGFTCATADEALRLVRLEGVASERLWVDVEFAALEELKAPKPSRPKKPSWASRAKSPRK